MIDSPSRLVLLGHPVAHSISPQFQNAALRAAGIPLTYGLLDVPPAELGATLRALREERAAGNATIPLKELLAERCTQLSPLAARVGAANVFWHQNGELIGDNSDVGGAEMVIRALLGDQVTNARLALIGAGGSAASVLCAAERCGIPSAVVYNRNMARAEHLVERFPTAGLAPSLDAALRDATIVVNATPVGLHDSEYPVAVEWLPTSCAVFDLVYTRGETAWVTAARAAGHRAADGEGMLIEQGAIAFEMWFGIAPDRNAMWKAIH